MDEETLPHGLRLNNPGNIEKGQKWRGLSADQPDPRFCKFDTPEYGLRAICKILQTYHDAYAVTIIQDVIKRWAPQKNTQGKFENNTEAYIKNVCTWTGFSRHQALDTNNAEHMKKIMSAITHQEQGVQPFTDEQLQTAFDLSLNRTGK